MRLFTNFKKLLFQVVHRTMGNLEILFYINGVSQKMRKRVVLSFLFAWVLIGFAIWQFKEGLDSNQIYLGFSVIHKLSM